MNGPDLSSDLGSHRGSRRSHLSGSSGESTQEGNRRESYGPDVVRDFPALARLRTAVEDRGVARRDWSDYAIIAGAILLAGAILTTLLLALGINARANRLVASEALRTRADTEAVLRIERKIDGAVVAINNNSEELAELARQETTTTTRPSSARRSPSSPSTTIPRRTPTTTPTTRATSPPAPPTPPATAPSCSLALLNTCLLR